MKLGKKLLTYLIMIGLAFICALNYQLFVFPNRFAPAGLNGICTMIQYVSGISVGYLSLIINIPLALLTLWKVGRSLALRSTLYVTCFSVFLLLLQRMDLSRFAYETANGTSTILGPLVAGLINGACYAFLARYSSCSGGTDFVAALIHKNHPEQNFFWITFILNVMVAVSSYFVYDYQMEPVILCILYSFMSSTVSDRLLKSGRTAIRCEIITDYPQELANELISQLHHSATLLPAKGMYLGKETNILVCVVNKNQVAALTAIVRQFPKTFAILSSVNEVMGNFKHIDTHGHQEREFLDRGDGKTV